MKSLILLGSLVLAPTLAAKPLPPVGKRVYLLDKAPEVPARIEGIEFDSEKGHKMMRDPLPMGKEPMKRIAEPAVVNEPKKSSQLKFEQVAVDGRFMVPRASFDKPRLQVRKAEEPVKQEYKVKIKESEDLLKDFSW